MDHRLRTIATVFTVALLASGPAFAQSQSESAPAADPAWEMPRLADGQPDLQGYWTTQTFTPMERPEYLGDQAFYTEEEFALLESQLTVDGADPLARFVIEIEDPEERARALDQNHRDEILRPLRQRHLACHPGAEGAVDPAHLADRRSAERPDPPGSTSRRRRGPRRGARRAATGGRSTATRCARTASAASTTVTTRRRCNRPRTTTSTRSSRRRRTS